MWRLTKALLTSILCQGSKAAERHQGIVGEEAQAQRAIVTVQAIQQVPTAAKDVRHIAIPAAELALGFGFKKRQNAQ